MSVRIANEIRAADLPMYCAACGNQNPELRHIDFDAACDRGYGEGGTVAMDDLILCETCLTTGAALIDLQDVTVLQERIASLEQRLVDEQKRADQAANYASRMEDALSNRPTPVKVSRPRGRPRKQQREEVAA